jgi:hypothetical protein
MVSLVKIPTTLRRVVSGLEVTIESCSPRSALSNVDLPALGLPMMATYPNRDMYVPDVMKMKQQLRQHVKQ